MHVAAADVLLGGQARPAVDDRLVPRRRGDDLLLPAVERMRRGRQDDDAGAGRGRGGLLPGRDQLGAQTVERLADAADRLELGRHDLGVDPRTDLAAQRGRAQLGARGQLEGDRVDEVELLLDPEGGAGGDRPGSGTGGTGPAPLPGSSWAIGGARRGAADDVGTCGPDRPRAPPVHGGGVGLDAAGCPARGVGW